MRLILSVTPLALALPLLDIGVLALIVILVHRGEQPDDALEQQQDVVEAVNFELFEERPAQIPLILELLHEGALLVDALQVFNDADLFSRINLLIELKKFLDDLFEHALLSSVF